MIGKQGQALPMGLQAGEYFAPKPTQIVLGQLLGTLLLHLRKRLVDGRIGVRIGRATHTRGVQFHKGRRQGFRAVRPFGHSQSLRVQLIEFADAFDPAIRERPPALGPPAANEENRAAHAPNNRLTAAALLKRHRP
jgi:hypothetical protein